MPRGIPKDPNHPRNQKKTAAAAPVADAPKRRGRPPGVKNKTAQTAAPVAAKGPAKKSAGGNVVKKIVEVSSLPSHGIGQNFDYHWAIRSNLESLAKINNPSQTIVKLIEAQASKLIELTTEAFTPPTVEEEVEAPKAAPAPAPVAQAAPSNGAQQTQSTPLPAPPNFMPPPFPTAPQS